MNRRTILGTFATLATAGCLSNVPGLGSPVDANCPDLSDEADSLCSHTANPPLSLHPSSWELTDGSEVSLKFTLSNDTDGAATFANFPSLKRRTDDGWEHLWPMVIPPLERQLDSGDAYAWEFNFYHTGSDYDADELVELYELEAGTYAAVVGAELGDRAVQCVAPFSVGEGD